MWELEYMVAVNVLYGKSLVLAISDTVAFGSMHNGYNFRNCAIVSYESFIANRYRTVADTFYYSYASYDP